MNICKTQSQSQGKNTQGTAVHPFTGNPDWDNVWQMEKVQKSSDKFSSFFQEFSGADTTAWGTTQ